MHFDEVDNVNYSNAQAILFQKAYDGNEVSHIFADHKGKVTSMDKIKFEFD